MPQVEPQIFYKELENGKISPLYFLFGDEPYLIKQSLEKIKCSVVAPEMNDFNFSQYYATDVAIQNVKDEIDTLPMMCSQRLIFLKETQSLSDKEWSVLNSSITNPVESTVFVMTASRVDKRKKIIKDLLSHACCIEFKKPYDNQVPSWIHYIVKNKNMEITSEATAQLHRLVGNNLTEIHSEIEKLSDFLGEEKKIGLQDVNQVVSRSKVENIFDFTKAMGKNNRILAIEHLVHLLDQGQNEIGIVSLLARHLRVLLAIRRGLDDKLSGARLAHYAQVPIYFIDEYVSQARLWSGQKIEKTLVLLCDTDKALKSSPLSSHIWLENLILKTCE